MTGDKRLRNDMVEEIERRYALIEGEYKGEYFKEHETSRFARATNPNLIEDPMGEGGGVPHMARKAKYENPGIAASFFYCLKKTMFGEARRHSTGRERERDQAESPRGPEMATLVKEKAPGRKVRD